MLTRWDPFRDMMTMRRTMDRLIENSLGEEMEGGNEWGLPLDVIETEDGYQVKASVPGINPEDLDITYNQGLLTIKGEIKADSEDKQGKYHLRERRYGVFSRTISLPSTVDADRIDAAFKDGVLTLDLPKAEAVKPKRIAIKAGDSKQIEGFARK